MPWLISTTQRARFRGPDARFAHWSHCALVVDGDGSLVEAETFGVTRSPIEKYRPREYAVIRTSQLLSPEARARSAAYAEGTVGSAFGFAVLVSLGIWLVTGIRVRFARRNHQICSGLVAHALAEGGLRPPDDPTFTLPADMARAYDAPG